MNVPTQNPAVLTDAEFDAAVAALPIRERMRLTRHNAVLRVGTGTARQSGGEAAAERARIVDAIRVYCGAADTVRANHARKLAHLIETGVL
jgi:hypothetical protein